MIEPASAASAATATNGAHEAAADFSRTLALRLPLRRPGLFRSEGLAGPCPWPPAPVWEGALATMTEDEALENCAPAQARSSIRSWPAVHPHAKATRAEKTSALRA